MRYLIHPFTGKVKQAPEGYCLSCLFFGAFPALFRGDFLTFFVAIFATLFGSAAIAAVHPVLGALSIFAPPIILSFLYNDIYYDKLVSSGYVLHNKPQFAPVGQV